MFLIIHSWLHFTSLCYTLPFLNKSCPLTFQADSLQRELQETSRKLQSVQAQVYQAENSKLDLQDKKDRVTTLKNQLDGEKLQRYVITF